MRLSLFSCLSVIASIFACAPAGAVQYWANNSEGWIDPPQMGGEGCGIATATTMIWWWQQQSGISLPGLTTWDQLFVDINGHFDSKPTFVHDALRYYLETHLPSVNYGDVVIQSPYLWKSTDYQGTSDYLRDYLSKGYLVGLDSNGHAINVWGGEFDDATGMVTKIWLTDPGPNAPDDTLEPWPAEWNDQGLYFVTRTETSDSSTVTQFSVRWLYAMKPIQGENVPEPASSMLALGGLCGLCLRRRRTTC